MSSGLIHKRMAISHKTLDNGNRTVKTLERRAVVVEGRKISDRVIAIVQPVEEVKENRGRIQGQPLFSNGEERPA